jgi:hypothetical protein
VAGTFERQLAKDLISLTRLGEVRSLVKRGVGEELSRPGDHQKNPHLMLLHWDAKRPTSSVFFWMKEVMRLTASHLSIDK